MIHIVLYNPANAVSDIVSAIKQNSTYRLWAKFSYVLQKHYWKKKHYGPAAILLHLSGRYPGNLSKNTLNRRAEEL